MFYLVISWVLFQRKFASVWCQNSTHPNRIVVDGKQINEFRLQLSRLYSRQSFFHFLSLSLCGQVWVRIKIQTILYTHANVIFECRYIRKKNIELNRKIQFPFGWWFANFGQENFIHNFKSAFWNNFPCLLTYRFLGNGKINTYLHTHTKLQMQKNVHGACNDIMLTACHETVLYAYFGGQQIHFNLWSLFVRFFFFSFKCSYSNWNSIQFSWWRTKKLHVLLHICVICKKIFSNWNVMRHDKCGKMANAVG